MKNEQIKMQVYCEKYVICTLRSKKQEVWMEENISDGVERLFSSETRTTF